MRRKDKVIKNHSTIEFLINKALICRIALSHNDIPYIVPMNFAYKDMNIYLHSSREGKKIDIIKKNNKVCFEIDLDKELNPSSIPCNWTMKYYSVIGFGTASFIEDIKEKKNAMNIIMQKYSGKMSWTYPERMIESVLIIKVKINKFTGKKSIHTNFIDN